MTGRGLALVEALATRWGVVRGPGAGKTVWAEFVGDQGTVPDQDQDAGDRADWEDDEAPASEERFTVILGDVPTDLLIEAKAHMDNLVREFSLTKPSGESAELPEHFRQLIETVVHSFSDARDAIKRQALAAAALGQPADPADTAAAGIGGGRG